MRLSKERSPSRPLSWAVTIMAATIGPKAPRSSAGTGSEEIRPRPSSTVSPQKSQVNAKAMTMYFSGKAFFVVVRDGVAVAASISKLLSLVALLWSVFSDSRSLPLSSFARSAFRTGSHCAPRSGL